MMTLNTTHLTIFFIQHRKELKHETELKSHLDEHHVLLSPKSLLFAKEKEFLEWN